MGLRSPRLPFAEPAGLENQSWYGCEKLARPVFAGFDLAAEEGHTALALWRAQGLAPLVALAPLAVPPDYAALLEEMRERIYKAFDLSDLRRG